MKSNIPALLLVLGAAAPLAHAQQSGDLSGIQLHGRQVFAQSCGVCHLPPALNAKTYGPVLDKASAAGNDEVMKAIIVNGTERMPAFKYYLKPAEIEAIVAYVRTVAVQAVRPTSEAKGESQ